MSGVLTTHHENELDAKIEKNGKYRLPDPPPDTTIGWVCELARRRRHCIQEKYFRVAK